MPRSAAVPLSPGSSSPVDLVSHWRLRAPVEPVWAALADPAGWPAWWPEVPRVQTLHEGGADGMGSVWRLEASARLPRRIIIEVEAVEALRHHRLRARSHGPLEGEALWLLRAEDGFTDVTHVWRVRLSGRWLRWFAPLLAPVLRWNHAGVMRAGEAGLRRHLARDAPRG